MGAAESNLIKVSFYAQPIEDTDAAALVEKGAGGWASMAIEFCDVKWPRVLDAHAQRTKTSALFFRGEKPFHHLLLKKNCPYIL